MSKFIEISKLLVILAAILLFLEAVLVFFDVASYIAPKPSEIWIAFLSHIEDFAIAWRVTLSETLVGLTLAFFISSFLAAATLFLPISFAKIINTIGMAVQSTPLLAITPLLSLWLGQSFAPKAAASCIVCFFPLLTGWLGGIRSVELEQLQLFENLGANRWQRAVYLIIPNALPFFFGGLRIAFPLALLGAIVGEFVGASEGIGFRILSNSYYVRTSLMFAYVLVAAGTGLVFTGIISLTEKNVLFWHGQRREF